MPFKKRMNKRAKLCACVFFAVLSLLLVGAAAKAADAAGRTRPELLAGRLVEEMPAEHRSGWQKLSEDKSLLLVRLATLEMREVY